MPGYTYCFVDTVASNCLCPICKLPMQSPVRITSCQHTFCDSCLRLWHGNSADKMQCPLDELAVDVRNVHPSTELQDLIEESMVHCPQQPHGCKWVDVVLNVTTHLEKCRYVAVPCPSNCGALICKLLLKDHLAHMCTKRKFQCTFCDASFSVDEFEKHEGNCQHEPIWCENKCGVQLPRHKMQLHADLHCDKRLVQCCFCKRSFISDTLQTHVQQCNLRGSRSSSGTAAAPAAVSSSAASTPSLEQKGSCASSSSANGTLDSSCRFGSTAMQQQQQQQQQHCERVAALESSAAADEIVPPPRLQRRRRTGSVDALTVQLPARFSDCPLRVFGCTFKGERNSVEQHLQECAVDHVTLLADVVRTQRREIDTLRRQIRHLPLVQNGELLWRIDNYQRKLSESQCNSELEFCSVAFYSSRPGYRLQASAFLNGNGTAAGRYTSLYAKLLPGEFDPLLQWPFSQPIEMSLLDQSGAGANLTESFTPDATWKHFRRPVREAAAYGFGYPRFVSHEAMSAGQFVKEDTIFIRIRVLQQ